MLLGSVAGHVRHEALSPVEARDHEELPAPLKIGAGVMSMSCSSNPRPRPPHERRRECVASAPVGRVE